MRLAFNILMFYFCLNLSAYILPYYIALPTYFAPIQTPEQFLSYFSIHAFDTLITLGATIGVVALLMRTGTYAVYALIIAAIGILYTVFSPFLDAFATLLVAILPIEMNPTPIILLIRAINMFAIFWFFIEFMTSRNVH